MDASQVTKCFPLFVPVLLFSAGEMGLYVFEIQTASLLILWLFRFFAERHCDIL